jgi:methylmalonyl-CoA/ethylmalonyl-CoA epimerase
MRAGRIAELLASLPADILPLSSGLDHIGVAVESLEEGLALYRDLLGLKFLYEESIESDGVRVAVLELGGGHLELLEPTGPDTPVGRYVAKRGSGIHHVALRVKNCARALEAVAAAGYQLIDNTPRPGAGGKQIGFVHPKATGGVLLELCQPA